LQASYALGPQIDKAVARKRKEGLLPEKKQRTSTPSRMKRTMYYRFEESTEKKSEGKRRRDLWEKGREKILFKASGRLLGASRYRRTHNKKKEIASSRINSTANPLKWGGGQARRVMSN